MTIHLLALYGGPDQIVPLQTGLAALLTFAVMFWGKLVAFFHRLFARSTSKPQEIAPADAAVPEKTEQNRE
jgi:hypothetical protein